MSKNYEPIVLCPACGKKHFISAHTVQWVNTEPTHTLCPFCGKINEVEKKKIIVMVKMNNNGIVRCSMCDSEFKAKEHISDKAKSYVKCPFCDEMMKVTNLNPPRPQEPTIYYLVTYAHFVNGDSLEHASWCTRDDAFGGLVWKNFVGGMCPCQDEDRVHEVTMANDIMELDWTKTYMLQGLKEDFYSGWLSPNGEFVQSARNMYDNTAEFIIGKEPDELKREGWLRLERYEREPYYTPRKFVTKQQYHWLEKYGYTVYGIEDME